MKEENVGVGVPDDPKEIVGTKTNYPHSQNGITLISLIITIIVLTIIAAITIYKMGDSTNTSRFNRMKADIELLHDKILAYNQKYDKLPVIEENGQPKTLNINDVEDLLLEGDHDQRAPNDSETYYIVDVKKLENVTLNYGNGSEEDNDYYIVNSTTFNVYYAKGIPLERNTYHIGKEYTGTLFPTEDKEKPVVTSKSSTTNSITFTGTDNNGIIGYSVTTSSSVPSNWTTITSTKTFTQTLNSLTQDVTYYIWLKDEEGNVNEVSSIKTGTMPILDGNITFTYTPSTWINGNVVVTISTEITGYTLQYSQNETTWTNYTSGITYTENGEIYARLTDGTNVTNTATGNITNIDKTNPSIGTITPQSNSVTFAGTDTISGIIAYGYSESSTLQPTNWTNITATTNLTNRSITGLTKDKTYYVWAKDQAGNMANKVLKTIDAFEFILAIPSNDLTYTLNLPTGSYNGKEFEYNFIVDWGDGTTSEVISQADTQKIHTYTEAKDYTIKIVGIAEGAISFRNDKKLKELLTGFPKSMKITREDFSHNFYHCDGLTGNIPENLFASTPNVTSFFYTFYYCGGLTGNIPENLFASTPNVTSFSSTFDHCDGLTGNIPENLFASTPNVTSFSSTFYYCGGLTGNIPTELFANTPDVISFNGIFSYCDGLTGNIPENLFASTPNVTSFDSTFYYCSGLTGNIPENLFASTPNVTSFDGTFRNCYGLRGSIPTELFANTPDVTSFFSTFEGCISLTGSIPAELFVNTPNVMSFAATFYNCYGLTGDALPLWERGLDDYSRCYYNCTGLSNYNSIPSAWKDEY